MTEFTKDRINKCLDFSSLGNVDRLASTVWGQALLRTKSAECIAVEVLEKHYGLDQLVGRKLLFGERVTRIEEFQRDIAMSDVNV